MGPKFSPYARRSRACTITANVALSLLASRSARPSSLLPSRKHGGDHEASSTKQPPRPGAWRRAAATRRLRLDPGRLATLVPADGLRRAGRDVAAGLVALPGRGACRE